ncbi:MAG: hypothetical protein ACI8PT_002437 [Gammaproteobacteria bacterium]|jgi:hypothetical protein
MDELGSYSVESFISFQPESYFRLFERQFETFWPLHLLLFAIGVAAVAVAWSAKIRFVSTLLAASLIAVAISFQFRLYDELTPVGRLFGWAFLLEALLILIWGFISRSDFHSAPSISHWTGLSLAGIGVALYPFLTLAGDRTWKGAEYFGLAPDPTICAVLGIVLIGARPIWLLMLMPIPLLWAAVSAATLRALDALALHLLVVIAIALMAALIKTIYLRREYSGSRTSSEVEDSTN